MQALGTGFEITFRAQDPGGRVARVEYALNGKVWRTVAPLDGVADSAEEDYRLEIDPSALEGSSRHVVLRITDAAGNLGGDMRRLDR